MTPTTQALSQTQTADTPSARRKRVRLPPAVRKAQILDAALAEFSAQGYAATSMERIACRVGLSKPGLYAHYASKDQVFEDLVRQVMGPSLQVLPWMPAPGGDMRAVIEAFVEQLYQPMQEPRLRALMRMLISEGHRTPHLMQWWRCEVLEPHLLAQQQALQQAVAQGWLQASPLTENFLLLVSPMLHDMLWQLMFDMPAGASPLCDLRASHTRLLLSLARAPAA